MYIITWEEIANYLKNGNETPPKRVEKTEAEWANLLDEEAFYVTRKHGTERPGSGLYCETFEPGIYGCICCKTILFDANEKFDSGTGWPSFTQPVGSNVVKYILDRSLMGRDRVEAQCSVCDAHLGHVFPDGPEPSGLRYCMNSAALEKIKDNVKISPVYDKRVLAGGCFWCTEAMFLGLRGVVTVESGFSGGILANPSYKEVCNGDTGHAECIRVTFDPKLISYSDLIDIHLHSHDPTQLNGQGADIGTHYRSVIFYQTDADKILIENRIQAAQTDYDLPIVTQVAPESKFYIAEDYHQNYYELNQDKNPYCSSVVSKKLKAMREKYSNRLK